MVFDLTMEPADTGELRVALVTGASRGIGLATARRLAADGLRVILVARSEALISAEAEQLRRSGHAADAIACDLADREAVGALMRGIGTSHGRLDVLVNNAAYMPVAKHAETITFGEWDATLELNLTVPWSLSGRAKELMGDRGGVIVNVASTAAYYPSRGLAAYHVSKAALLMLTRVCALEWARSNIRVVGVAPGKIDTEMLAPIMALVAQGRLALNPQGRPGSSDEVAGLISYLVSDAASYVTGVVVPIDGGELLVTTSDQAK
jgi:NAD(P)-dependent dehydrogenase (short-subunit alcohol dehydrogenase family)